MFVGDEIMLDIGFTAAQARLVNLARRGGLSGASRAAYADELSAMIRVGPFGGAAGSSRAPGAIRSLIRTRLALPGAPQMLLQLGPARTTQATARRSPAELIGP
jgi:hypothetical protein